MGPDVDLADQDFKATIINIFTELNENMSSELKKNILGHLQMNTTKF